MIVYSTIIQNTTNMVQKLEGSVELKDSLPYGALKKITEAFGFQGPSYVSEVISGKRTGNKLLIECAMRISDAYLDCGFEEELEKILKDYDTTANETRK